jgi:hypothetical protein
MTNEFDSITETVAVTENDSNAIPFDAMFSGVIGQDYQLLKIISPLAAEMSRLVGVEVGKFCRQHTDPA